MKKQHWIALVACTIAVVIFVESRIWYGGEPGLMYCYLILSGVSTIILPLAMTYKQRIWVTICASAIALSKLSVILLFPTDYYYGIVNHAVGTSAASIWLYWYGPKVLGIFEVLFCILIVMRFYKQVKPWVLYIYPIVSLIFSAVGAGGVFANYEVGRALSCLWWYVWHDGMFLQPFVLLIAVYLLVNEAPERIKLKEKVQINLFNDDKTGYTYLDEYKKNMKK